MLKNNEERPTTYFIEDPWDKETQRWEPWGIVNYFEELWGTWKVTEARREKNVVLDQAHSGFTELSKKY